MSTRFDYVKYDEEAMNKQVDAKAKMLDLELWAEANLPPSRSLSLVLTKLEEAYMWIGKAIRDEQVARRKAELEECRSAK